jgi:hypothetical protein
MDIVIGTRVRSFDFHTAPGGRDLEGDRACYVEGEVVGFDLVEGCRRYRILVDRDVFGGKDEDRRLGALVTPPVNGTPYGNRAGQPVTNFVELV